MKNQIGLSAQELDKIFSQIRDHKVRGLDRKIYAAYLPLRDELASSFKIKKDDMCTIYNDVFSYLYNNVLNGVLKPSEFGVYFKQLLTKQCSKHNLVKNEFNSDLLSKSYTRNISEYIPETNASDLRAKEFATQSLLFITELFNKMINNPQLAEQHDLNKEKICIVMDHFGLNAQHKSYTIAEMAEKYEITESRVRALLATSLKKLRSMEEFEPIKHQLHKNVVQK